MKIEISEYANAAAKKTGGIGKGNALLYVEFCANYMFGNENGSDFPNLIITVISRP